MIRRKIKIRGLGRGGKLGVRRGVDVLTARQARAARCVLGLSVAALAKSSGISASSIRRVEDGQDATVTLDLTVRLQSYFEQRGFVFRFGSGSTGVDWPDDLVRPR